MCEAGEPAVVVVAVAFVWHEAYVDNWGDKAPIGVLLLEEEGKYDASEVAAALVTVAALPLAAFPSRTPSPPRDKEDEPPVAVVIIPTPIVRACRAPRSVVVGVDNSGDEHDGTNGWWGRYNDDDDVS